MRKLLAVMVVTVAACGQGAEPTTTIASSSTSQHAAATTTTKAPALEYRLQDCGSPPVTFSSLCEVFELLEEWHVDRPIVADDLAGVALRALRSYSGTETEPVPRTLICSLPDRAFEPLCAQLAEMVQTDGIAVGPAVDHAVLAMADRALDPFTYYVPPDQVGAFRSNGVVGGVGVLLDAPDAAGSKCAVISRVCPIEIVFVVEDNPGATAGLVAGDIITAVDGSSVEGSGFVETVGLIAGEEKGTVELTIDRSGETLVFDIERAELTVPTVEVRLPLSGVGYLRIPDFESDIPGLVQQGLESLSEFSPHTIVVDLRDNPGGFIDSAVETTSMFVDGGVVLVTDGPDEHVEYPAEPGGLATAERLIVIVNKGSASAAEVVAGALRDRREALVVGVNTFGKDTVQIPFELRNGGELYVAVARWSTPTGVTVGTGGLSPDRELDLTPGMTVEEVVAAALEAAR